MSDFFEKLKKEEPYTEYTLDMFSKSAGKEASEVGQFNNWRNMVSDADKYTFEVHNETAKNCCSAWVYV